MVEIESWRLSLTDGRHWYDQVRHQVAYGRVDAAVGRLRVELGEPLEHVADGGPRRRQRNDGGDVLGHQSGVWLGVVEYWYDDRLRLPVGG